MKLRKEKPFISQRAMESLKTIDFSDTFATTNHTDSLENICRKIFENFPSWVERMMNIRNTIMAVFGHKYSMPDDYHTHYSVGGFIGFFKIYHIDDQEIILGANDKHLNFRASIIKTNDRIYNLKVTTLVHFHNQFGKVYMKIISPFHVLIMKTIVKKAFVVTKT